MAVGAGLMALTMDPTIILHDSEDSACDPCIPRDAAGMQSQQHDADAPLGDGPSPRTSPGAAWSIPVSSHEEFYYLHILGLVLDLQRERKR